MSAKATSGVARGLILALIIGAWIAIAGAAGSSFGKLSQVTTNDQETFLPRSAESVLANEALRDFDQNGMLPAIIVLMGEQPYADAFGGPPAPGGPPGAAYAADLVTKIDVGSTPLEDYLVAGTPPVTLAADDKSGIAVILPLDNHKVSQLNSDEKSYLSHIVADIRDQAADATSASDVYVTGPAGFAADIGTAFSGIDGLLLIVTLSVVLLILVVVYRSLLLPVIVLLAAGTSLAVAGSITYLLARDGVLVVNGQTQGILSILVIGAATDYSLLLVARYREELTRTESRFAAMKRAWRACIEPIAASAGTVSAGLLCLLLSDMNSNRSLGPVGAIGIAAALVVIMLFLPALLLMGRWIFWPRIPRVGSLAQHDDHTTGIWARVAEWVRRRPRTIWVTVSAVLLAACLAIPTFQASGTSEADLFLTKVDAVAGNDVLGEHFNVGKTDPLRIVTEADSAQQLTTELAGLPGIESAQISSPVVDGHVVVDASLKAGTDPGASVEEVRQSAHAIDGDALVGGKLAIEHDSILTSQHDLKLILPVVLLVVFLILTLLLRAIVAPLMLMLATVVSFGAALGVSALVFNHLFDFPGADPAVPLLGFVFLVALGVDYSIFLMTRAREEVARHGPVKGMTDALSLTGSVITSAGVVLAATFATLSVLPLLFMVQMAFIVAFGVLLDTFIVRSLLVPAMAIDAKALTWWPSRLSRKEAAAAQ